jgi:hypothetical protein
MSPSYSCSSLVLKRSKQVIAVGERYNTLVEENDCAKSSSDIATGMLVIHAAGQARRMHPQPPHQSSA